MNGNLIDLIELIDSLKQRYYERVSQKLSSVCSSSKCYWSFLKIPVISPLVHNNNFISKFKEKSKLSREPFCEQCSLMQNNSTLPSAFTPLTHNLLSLFQFTAHDIKSIRNILDPSNTHGHDMISICMMKLSYESIYKPLEVIFKSCLNQGVFSAEHSASV